MKKKITPLKKPHVVVTTVTDEEKPHDWYRPETKRPESLPLLQEIETRAVPFANSVRSSNAGWFYLHRAYEVSVSGRDIQKFYNLVDQDGPKAKIRRLFHGTAAKNIDSVISNGLVIKKNRGGLFGDGVYLGEIKKAINYTEVNTKHGGWTGQNVFILAVEALTSHEFACQIHNPDAMSAMQKSGCQSVHGRAGWTAGINRNDEWVVYEQDRVIVTHVLEYKPRPAEVKTKVIKMEVVSICVGLRPEPLPSTEIKSLLGRDFKMVGCTNSTYTKLKTDKEDIFLCDECIRDQRIRIGSVVTVLAPFRGHAKRKILGYAY